MGGWRSRMKRLIHKKQLDPITSVEFSYKDVSIWQDGSLVVLTKDEVIEIAKLIEWERHDLELLENRGKKNANWKAGS